MERAVKVDRKAALAEMTRRLTRPAAAWRIGVACRLVSPRVAKACRMRAPCMCAGGTRRHGPLG